MTNNLHEIAVQAERLVGLRAGDLVVDIGCNDGTLFDGYRTTDLRCLGFDPSDVAQYAIDKGYDVIRDFFRGAIMRDLFPDRKAKIITSIAMFYDLEHPAAFVSDIAANLAEDGVWVIELSYLPLMLEHNSFDTICHEHLEYYSLAVLERLLSDAGMVAISAELNDVNGGSIRLFAAHNGQLVGDASGRDRLQALRIREFELALDSDEPYQRFAQNAERVRVDLIRTVHEIHESGKVIHLYGASTKGNTILQYCNIGGDLVPYAADRNEDKWGSETIRTKIPIISEVESRAMKPDFYLVMPWHFLNEFMSREQEFLDRGGKFLVPLPEVRIVDRSTVSERRVAGGAQVTTTTPAAG